MAAAPPPPLWCSRRGRSRAVPVPGCSTLLSDGYSWVASQGVEPRGPHRHPLGPRTAGRACVQSFTPSADARSAGPCRLPRMRIATRARAQRDRPSSRAQTAPWRRWLGAGRPAAPHFSIRASCPRLVQPLRQDAVLSGLAGVGAFPTRCPLTSCAETHFWRRGGDTHVVGGNSMARTAAKPRRHNGRGVELKNSSPGAQLSASTADLCIECTSTHTLHAEGATSTRIVDRYAYCREGDPCAQPEFCSSRRAVA